MADVTEKICYDLPTTVDTETFGPVYWSAFHDLANRIPCDGCKREAESFVRFWHDTVNKKLGKPIFDTENYRKWVAKITRQNKINTIIIVSLSVITIVSILIAIFKTKK